MTVFNDDNSVDLTISKVTLHSNAILQFKCESKVVNPINGIRFSLKSGEIPEWQLERVHISTHGVEYNFHTDLWLPAQGFAYIIFVDSSALSDKIRMVL